MTDTNVSSLVLKKGSNRYIFDPSGNLDLSNYYTKSDIDTKLNNYALKTEIPNTSNLATKTELNSVKTTAQNALNIANSKDDAFTSSNQGINPGRVYSYTLTKRAIILNTYGLYNINGYTPKTISLYRGEGSSSSDITFADANSVLTYSDWLSYGTDIGFYLI